MDTVPSLGSSILAAVDETFMTARRHKGGIKMNVFIPLFSVAHFDVYICVIAAVSLRGSGTDESLLRRRSNRSNLLILQAGRLLRSIMRLIMTWGSEGRSQ